MDEQEKCSRCFRYSNDLRAINLETTGILKFLGISSANFTILTRNVKEFCVSKLCEDCREAVEHILVCSLLLWKILRKGVEEGISMEAFKGFKEIKETEKRDKERNNDG